MDHKTRDGLTIIEGIEVIRRRPAMYIGPEEPGRTLPSRLLELIVDGVAHDTPPPQEIRVLLWCDRAITVAFDGGPLPIEPFGRPVGDVAHPALYQFFMSLFVGVEPFGRTLSFGAILNALSERLVVSTMHGDGRYRVVLAQGRIVTLLSRTPCERPLGTTWFTFRPDSTIITGASLSLEDTTEVTERVATNVKHARIVVHDRRTEEPDWY